MEKLRKFIDQKVWESTVQISGEMVRNHRHVRFRPHFLTSFLSRASARVSFFVILYCFRLALKLWPHCFVFFKRILWLKSYKDLSIALCAALSKVSY